MDILLHPNTGGQYLNPLGRELKRCRNISSVYPASRLFWSMEKSADILHLQWPEAISDWEEPSEEYLQSIGRKIAEWSSNTAIVSTVHNRYPHNKNTKNYRTLYQTVYTYSDGVIHLGSESVKIQDSDYTISSDKLHEVIPHGMTVYPGTIEKESARRRLGVPKDARLILSFGSIRSPEEMELLLTGFGNLRITNAYLVIAGKVTWASRLSARYYQHWARALIHPRIQIFDKFIPDEKVHIFLSAADILVIPRTEGLNSGNIPLGFAAGKVVVGPDIGVMGELIRESGNPVFNPKSPSNLAQSLEDALIQAEQHIGNRNRKYAERRWQWSDIAKKHVQFYRRVLVKRDLNSTV